MQNKFLIIYTKGIQIKAVKVNVKEIVKFKKIKIGLQIKIIINPTIISLKM